MIHTRLLPNGQLMVIRSTGPATYHVLRPEARPYVPECEHARMSVGWRLGIEFGGLPERMIEHYLRENEYEESEGEIRQRQASAERWLEANIKAECFVGRIERD